MAQKVLKSAEEEYDAKQPPVEKKPLADEAEQWKNEIMAVKDEDLLRYISDIARAQCDLVCADDRLEGGDEEPTMPMEA